MNIIEKVKRSKDLKKSTVQVDDFTKITETCFDFKFEGESTFAQWEMPTKIPKEFSIGIIVGASGSGKSTLLSEFGQEENPFWDDNKGIVSHFETPHEAVDKLTAVGLNSIPAWVKPYSVLSTGEKFRADLSRKLKDNSVIDEFTSVVDRNVAKASSVAISKYIKRTGLKSIVLATCHEDIIEWIEPDWVFDTNQGILFDGSSLRRPKIELEIFETREYELWNMFKNHHYLSENLNKASRRFLAVWNGQVVGMTATMPLPSGTLKNAWRGHRTVILPDFQGMGLGTRLSDAIAQIHIDEGKRYYSKTAHIRMGEYRQLSELWKPTSKNKKKRDEPLGLFFEGAWKIDPTRVCYSHEYIGKTLDKSN